MRLIMMMVRPSDEIAYIHYGFGQQQDVYKYLFIYFWPTTVARSTTS